MIQFRILMSCVLLLVFFSACSSPPQSVVTQPAVMQPAEQGTGARLTGIQTYLLEKNARLLASAADLKGAAGRYYDLASAQAFDYGALWESQPAEVAEALQAAKTAWLAASPLYEQVEGIVAGVPSLSEYDVILDAGASAEEDPDNAVPFDLTLPDGRVLEKPGNLFGVLESALWGTESNYTVSEVQPDLDGSGSLDFGEALPDANVLKGAADLLYDYVLELDASARAWEPDEQDAFTALVVMIPTMSEYFISWKNSRFVSGEASTQRDFVAISRLADIQDILSGLQVVYLGVKPLAAGVDSAQSEQIERGLSELKEFVAGVHAQERSGKRFTSQDADLLGAEAQNQAAALAGQISQIAARLDIPLDQ